MKINKIEVENKIYYLKDYINLDIENQKTIWSCESSCCDTKFLGCGKSEKESIQDFMVDFEAVYNYLNDLDNNLSLDALIIRDNIKKLIEKIEDKVL